MKRQYQQAYIALIIVNAADVLTTSIEIIYKDEWTENDLSFNFILE